ncbi:MAG: methyltransferase domain-containing protein, partial [Bdellovibrionota bacterium]
MNTLSQNDPRPLAVSLLIPARNSAHTLEKTVTVAHTYLTSRYRQDFEIILIPNSDPKTADDGSLGAAKLLAKRFNNIIVCPHNAPVGKGAALKTGFNSSKGGLIFFTDADLPYDLEFFDHAALKLKAGYAFITGNRRLLSSLFCVSVKLLPLAYGRHKLGLLFNKAVRLLFPISVTDTQAGIKAMSREFATKAFSLQSCPGFFFDIEFFLTARKNGYRHAELPVTLFLSSEKSTVRLMRDSILSLYWLARIFINSLSDRYGTMPTHLGPVILKRFSQIPFSTRLFLLARWYLTPYGDMASYLPDEGNIMDIGCGHGLLSLAAAIQQRTRNVLGVDHDNTRINIAKSAASGLPNLKFQTSTLTDWPKGSFQAITMIDVMHYFNANTQGLIVKNAFNSLESGGKLLLREVDPGRGVTSLWNKIYEKLATATG